MVSDKARSDIITLAILWIVFSAIAEAVAAYFVGGYPGTASRQGEVTSEAVFFLLWVTIPVFVLVVLIVFYSMIRFRVADDDDAPSESQYRSGRAFPWGWVAISVVLNVLFVIHPGLTGLTSLWSMAQAATDAIEVDVTARQWGWEIDYPGQDLEAAPELVVPVDTPTRFVLRSDDVIHSFWVPAWGIKKAVIPGQTRTLVVTPTKLLDTAEDPTARLQCSQICGVGHADMQAEVRVVSRADFDEWVTATRAAAAHEGMDMDGMDMPGMKHGDEMPGMDGDMDMPGMEHDTSDMNMPGMEHGDEMPGMNGDMDMPGMEHGDEMLSPEHDMSNMEMPATAEPADTPDGEMPMDDMPMNGEMPMDHEMQSESQN